MTGVMLVVIFEKNKQPLKCGLENQQKQSQHTLRCSCVFNLCVLAWRGEVFVFSGKNEEPQQSFSFQKSSLIGRTVRRISQVQGPIAYCLCSGLLFHLSRTLTVHCVGLYLARLRFHSQDTGMESECYQGEQKVCRKKTENVHPAAVNTNIY